MTATLVEHACVDCRIADTPPPKPRPAPHGGPKSRRCATHWRAKRHADRQQAREKRSEKVYGLLRGMRAQLLELQGGRCPICARGLDMDGRGRFRRTAHEHDHELAKLHDHPENQACPDCLRGLTCGWCNTELLVRIDLAAARRLLAYYENPPMAQLRTAGYGSTPEDSPDYGLEG
jgi:hypothetical protein